MVAGTVYGSPSAIFPMVPRTSGVLPAEPLRCRMGNLDVPALPEFLLVETMCTITTVEKNQILDEILAARRSNRQFRTEVPPEDMIREIIQAGLLAPFAALAVGGSDTKYFRQFFVFRKGSQSLFAASPLVMDAVRAMAGSLKKEMEKDPAQKTRAETFAQRLGMIISSGTVPGIGTAPYYIVVAERRGFPAVEKQSLAHCLENMWLKATALGLGFQIVSVTGEMSDNTKFCDILGIPAGAYELMGCAVGYAQTPLPPAVRPPPDDVTRWLK
jgi:nitroreductase